MVPPYSNTRHRRRRSRSSRSLKRSFRSLTASLLTIATILVFPGLLLNTLLHQTAFLLPSTSSLRTTPFSSFQFLYHAGAEEIVATNEWQLLSENDTIPAGLHVRMDLSTGEKWAKLASDEERDEDIKAAVHGDSEKGGDKGVASAVIDSTGALSIVDNTDSDSANPKKDANINNNDNTRDAESTITPQRDYEMMHRVMSQLPPEELERFGGLPKLPAIAYATPSSTPTLSELTEEQRQLFELRMEKLWTKRQEELKKVQDENVADLPGILRDRIRVIKAHLEDVPDSLKSLLEKRQSDDEKSDNGGNDDEGKEVVMANDILSALHDLEFQLSDVDMARDFHTLGGWPYLVALLDDEVHGGAMADDELLAKGDDEEAMHMLVDEIQALAAMTIGTAVSNLGEFRGWALESSGGPQMSALSLLISSFENELAMRTRQMAGGSMAIPSTASPSESNSKYKSRATYKRRAIYALGSLLRGNPTAQQFFVSKNGAGILVRNVLGTLSNVRGPTASIGKVMIKLDYKFASKVLALGEDVVMDVVLHQDDYSVQSTTSENDDHSTASSSEGTDSSAEAEEASVLVANRLVAAFTTEQWCDLSLRLLSPPTEMIGTVASRGIKERAMSAIRAFGPGCKEVMNDASWGMEEVKQVRKEWNREGSDDGLDSVYRRELLELVDGVIEALS